MTTDALLTAGRPVALIVGASSGIGEELAKKMVNKGYAVALIARRKDKLDALAAQLNQGYAHPIAKVYAHDVTQHAEVPALFHTITQEMPGLSVVIYNAGIMPEVEENEYNAEKDRQIVEVNLIGAMAWLNEAAQRFQHLQRGTLVGIGSVAGDRGRRKFPAYAASKAALETYLESLRNRLAVQGVKVITIKPGPVATPMTEGLKLPLIIKAEKAAHIIADAISQGREIAYVPGIWRPIMWIIRNIPSLLFRRLSI
jgi:short-subunit dehydrogenase